MRVIVVGLGVQGKKRQFHAGKDFVGTVDPVNEAADYRKIDEVPLSDYDAALLCVPDDPKVELIEYCLNNNKHVLLEKPLLLSQCDIHNNELNNNVQNDIHRLEALAQSKNLICYTAYNHRFEPHFVKMRDLIQSKVLGKIYHCRLFYGNGTARLVRESAWRDQGAGVLPDLGSHLLDTIQFWFEGFPEFSLTSSQCFENRSPDHVIISNFYPNNLNASTSTPVAIDLIHSNNSTPKIELEMTLLSWRNHFTCDIWAEHGSAHISSLCKWGPTTFIHRERVLPSGYPKEDSVTLTQSDPTWELEYQYFKKLCLNGGRTDLSTDKWINDQLNRLSRDVKKQVSNNVKKTDN